MSMVYIYIIIHVEKRMSDLKIIKNLIEILSLKNSISFSNEWKQLSSNCFPIHWALLVLQEN